MSTRDALFVVFVRTRPYIIRSSDYVHHFHRNSLHTMLNNEEEQLDGGLDGEWGARGLLDCVCSTTDTAPVILGNRRVAWPQRYSSSHSSRHPSLPRHERLRKSTTLAAVAALKTRPR